MKNVPCLAASTLLIAAFITGASADATTTQAAPTPQAKTINDPVSLTKEPELQIDHTPSAVSPPEQGALQGLINLEKDDNILEDESTRAMNANQAQVEAQRQQAAASQNWLLRSYEEQLQKNSNSQSVDESNNLYYRIASDKNLSKLAGVSQLDTFSSIVPPMPKTGANPEENNSLSLRPGTDAASSSSDRSSSKDDKLPPTSTPFIKPLVTPIDEANAAGMHNFYNTLPVAANSAGMPNLYDALLPAAASASVSSTPNAASPHASRVSAEDDH